LDDHFDDGTLGTNPGGTGSGFNADGGASESDSTAKFTNGFGWDRPRMTSKDGVAMGPGISRFEFLGISFAKNPTNPHTGSTDRLYLGSRAAARPTAWRATRIRVSGSRLKATVLPPAAETGLDRTSTLFYESSTDVSTKLASWTFDTLNWDDNNPATMNFTPVLDITLDLGPVGYWLVIEGDTISNLTGSFFSTYADAGITNELTTGYAAVFVQSENPGINTAIDRIVITEDADDGECPSADLNMDCKVNLEDFAILAANWLVDTRVIPQ
jgi:hypothetical protein